MSRPRHGNVSFFKGFPLHMHGWIRVKDKKEGKMQRKGNSSPFSLLVNLQERW